MRPEKGDRSFQKRDKHINSWLQSTVPETQEVYLRFKTREKVSRSATSE